MRRVSELIYTLAFFGCGFWALTTGLGTVLSGFGDLFVTGTGSCYAMISVALMLKVFGDVENLHVKTLVFVGVTAFLGGVWGLGAILLTLSGVLMITRGFKQINVLREYTSLSELRSIRKQLLEEAKDEELSFVEEESEDTQVKVSEDILDGFVGSTDYKRDIETWIDKDEFEKKDYSPEEIKAKAKRELRNNQLSLETMMELEGLNKKDTARGKKSEEKDLTNIPLE